MIWKNKLFRFKKKSLLFNKILRKNKNYTNSSKSILNKMRLKEEKTKTI